MLTFGELFAGIGGFSIGLERAGMTCKWQVEIDPYATAVLKKHWPQVPKWDDVRTFPPQGDWGVDLICGGFPCQDISVAGKGAGLAGARSGLWHEFARIIRAVRPRWVVIENVPALTARGLGTVLGDLAEIGMDAEWHCIPASAVGAPHRRDRIWIVAVRNADGEREACDCVPNAKHGRAVSQASWREPARVGGEPDVADSASGGQSVVRRSSRSARHADQRCQDVADAGFVDGSWGPRKQKPTDWEKAQRHEAANHTQRRGALVADANGAGLEQQRRSQSVRAEQPAVECGGWWESEPDVGRVAHGVPSRVDRLRCLGNAVVPQVVEIIGRAIIAHEERTRTASGMRP